MYARNTYFMVHIFIELLGRHHFKHIERKVGMSHLKRVHVVQCRTFQMMSITSEVVGLVYFHSRRFHQRFREMKTHGRRGGLICSGSLREAEACNVDTAACHRHDPKPCEWSA